MSPETWSDILSLLVLAFGGAMVLGTGAAMLTHRRTGLAPGQASEEDGEAAAPPSPGSAVAKLVIGGVLLAIGAAMTFGG